MRLMSLGAQYRQQFGWRSWNLVLDELPLRPGMAVLDLGCAIGDQARALAARGCTVIGLDANQELIDAARLEASPHCEFRIHDLRRAPATDLHVDGIWCSFVPSYFTRLAELLGTWAPVLKPGGWIALTEIDDLFGHEPLSARTRELLRGFADEARAAGRYDYHMGSKLESGLAEAGFAVSRVLMLPDEEFSFEGAARPEVVEAWRARFQRMPGLRFFCGEEFARVQEDFLACLSRPEHVSTARVISCVATKGG